MSQTPNNVNKTPRTNKSGNDAQRVLIKKLREAQRAVRRVDLTATFCAFLTIALGALLLGVLLDHWILSHGLTVRGRLYFAVGWVAFTLIFLIIRLIPIFRRRVTALYAAKVIEETQEDHNNLTINWLQLCYNQDGARKNQQSQNKINPSVLSVVATQAAKQARAHANELTLDCTALIRWGVALTVTVAICAAYLILSPKNSFASVGRIVAPFAEIERPQALSFRSVDPGDATVYLGDSLDVVAEIDGVGSRKVELLYSTEDQRLIDVPIEMESLGSSRYTARFPQGEDGFAENMTYRIVVGRQTRFESASDTYTVTTRPQPSFRVEQIRLNFPKYTGWEEKVLADQGDIVALEQTSVELRARANSQLQRAYFLPDGDVRRAIKMTIDPNTPNLATCQFVLNWKDNDRETAVQEFSTYRVISVDVDEQENRDAIDHNVTTLQDLPPEIQWISEPPQDDIWPVNSALQIKALAQDQDYSLRAVELHFAYSELNQGDQNDTRPDPEPVQLKLRETARVPLPADPDGPSPYVGAQTLNYELVPEKLGLVPGDEIEYWIVAFDSMRPQANVAVSDKRRLVIDEPSQNPTAPNQEDGEQEQNDDSKPENSDSAEQGQGQGQGNNQGGGQNSEQNSGQQNSDDNQDSQGEQNQGGQGENTQQSDGNDSNDDSSGSDSNEQSDSGDDRPNNDGENNSGGSEQNQDGDSGESQDSTGGAGEDQNAEPNAEGSQTGSDNSQSDAGAQQSDSQSASDAFETLLNYLRQEEDADQDANDGAGDSQDGQEDAQGGEADVNDGSDAPRDRNDRQGRGNNGEPSQNKPENEVDQKDEEPVDPNFNSQEDLPEPTEMRNLPTRTSPDKPKENSPSYLANDPPPLDPNVRRQNGEVQPDGNNFLAQNANDEDLANADNANARENITADPNDPNDQRASTKPDKNAREINGNGANPDIDENTEVDQDQPKRNDQRSNSSNPNADQLGDLGSQGQNDSDSDHSPTSEGGDSPRGDQANKGGSPGKAPGNGKENQNPEEKGGGGGSGAGEMGLGQQTLAPADAPNLQYAEKATNFVLDYLENALKDSVDPRLLNELDWSEEELRAFYERWKKMREEALDPNDPEAKRNYLDALNELSRDFHADLGVNEPLDSLREGQQNEGTPRDGMREATRVKTPERLQERVRAFNRGVASAGSKTEGSK